MRCSKMGDANNPWHSCKINRFFSLVLFTTLLFIPAVVTRASVLAVPAGGSLQAAINAAQPGDVIVLQAGATYAPVTLPNKAGSIDITIRSSRSDELPDGARVTPAQASLMAKVQASLVEAAVATTAGAHNYKFIGIEFTTTANNNYSLLRLGESEQNSLDQVPHHITLDRCYIHGQPTLNVQAGITLNSAHTSIVNSYISEIHWVGIQSYGVGSFNGPGPFTITNNYIEAAGLNIIFGGATPAIQNLVPSDITITRNHLHKPLAWKGVWTAVNLMELKSARRAMIADNLMENNWPDAQIGWAVIFNTFRDGGWEVVEDIQFLRNTIRNTTNGINLSGMDSRDMVLRMRRITVSDNRLEGLGFGGVEAKPFQVLNASEDITIDHNTVTSSSHSLTLDTAPGFSHVRLKFTNNLVPHNLYGVFANGGAVGVDAMASRATDWRMEKNAIIATPVDLQPKYPINYFPTSASGAGGLLGTDSLPVGARTGSSSTPTPTPTVTPTPTPNPTATPTPTPTPTPGPTPNGSTRFVNGYVKVGDEYFGGNSTVTLSVSGQLVQSYAAAPGGYFEFSSAPIGATLTASSPNYSFQRLTVDTSSPYFIIGATASSAPTPTPTPTPIPTPTPTPAPMAVSMINPTTDSIFSIGTSVTFGASASHLSGGSISSVAFQANSQLIGTATVAPYTVVSSTLAAGIYSVNAVARDTQGRTVTSSPITVKISKALKGVRNTRKNALTDSAFQASSQIDTLVSELEQTYLDFQAERTMFVSARRIDKYLFAALFLARSGATLSERPAATDAAADRISKVDAYLSFCEDLMVLNRISNATMGAANSVNAKVDLTITQPDTRPSSGFGFLSPNGVARITATSSIPFTSYTLGANGAHLYELADVSVTIKGQAAEVLSVSPTSITFMVPSGLTGGLAEVGVTSREGYMSYGTASVSGLNPNIFLQAGNGPGAILNALTIHSNTFATTTANQFLGLDSRTRLSIMATGISTGVANTDSNNDIRLESGQVLANLAESVVVEARRSNGTTVKLPVEYAGSQGVLSGLDQVNVVLPSSLAGAGSVQLTVVIAGVRSNSVMIVMQ